MRKQLDPRIPTLINNNVAKNHRSFVVLVGDKGRDQVVNLHYLLSQARVSARPSVLWCYKKELGFTSHRKKREAKIKREVKGGIREANEQNPFEIFVTVTDIRYTYYKESDRILGNTFGMCILQDFEAITPNLLARTIETVEGGGLVVLLLKTMTSLRQLYTMTMDVHARYRTSSHDDVVARFNERFILSLGSCESCLFLDDELNVLPISRGKDITPLAAGSSSKSAVDPELKALQESLADTKPAGDLVKLARTLDQGQAILTFIEAIVEKTLSSTVTLTAGRGRGKSAALGLSIAAALAHGYSNIFVTSPSPENLKTVFEFIFKGLDALGYEEHLDYDIMQSTNPDFNKAIVRVNIFRDHRQTIQYIQPQDAHVLGQAELVVIDEAAAIPLPLVRNLLGPYLVFMASTINGYEGTGRSLSLKLIQQLRESTRPSTSTTTNETDQTTTVSNSKKALHKAAPKSRSLREVKLSTPIRYSSGDGVEKWLNGLLCLDAALPPSRLGASSAGCPHPSKCELYLVSRDTLFSYHPASEQFLQRLMALSFASHYKNSPNDLQLLSDAPAHHLFVLLPPVKEDDNVLPEPLVVLQVAMEGDISKGVILEALRRGRGATAGGDMIPWVISSQFNEPGFASLSGARVVRIATNPDFANMGYGARALQALDAYYSGEYMDLDEVAKPVPKYPSMTHIPKGADLHNETLSVRGPMDMPPLLQKLTERKPEKLDWLGVSYGITSPLLRFWKRAGYVPLYIRQTPNELTGEYTCAMVRGISGVNDEDLGWLGDFACDFRKRFLSLLSYQFREFSSAMALSILEAAAVGVRKVDGGVPKVLTTSELTVHFSPYDIKRLDSYANNMVDYHAVLDLLPAISKLYFENHLGLKSTEAAAEGKEDNEKSAGDVQGLVVNNVVQQSILLAMGLQRKSVEDISAELQPLPVSQVLALFVKVMKKVTKRLQDVQKFGVVSAGDVPPPASSHRIGGSGLGSIEATIEDELDEAGEELRQEEQEKLERQRDAISSLDLRKFAIDDSSMDWSAAEAQISKGAHGRGVVSVKSSSAASAPGGKKRKADQEEGDAGAKGVMKKTRRGKGGKGRKD